MLESLSLTLKDLSDRMPCITPPVNKHYLSNANALEGRRLELSIGIPLLVYFAFTYQME